MKPYWSIRMRASRRRDGKRPTADGQEEIHISGAEGLYRDDRLQTVIRRYVERALHHPKGAVDTITITAERVAQEPHVIRSLPVRTVRSRDPEESVSIAREILSTLGIMPRAIHRALLIVMKGGMRGASLMSVARGTRHEPDMQRGVRVSRLGITPSAAKTLSRVLSRHRIDTETVKEAIILASKVLSREEVIAELCISDDPDYTTGYVASRKYGYIRIPNMKPCGSTSGGRVFFVSEGSNVPALVQFLERTPVMVGKVSSCLGIVSKDEIFDRSHR